MDRIMELSLQLLQATEALQSKVEGGDLAEVESLQLQRAELVAELDIESQNPWPRDVLIGCQGLIKQAQLLEQSIVKQLSAQRKEVGKEHSKLQLSKQARKAYDRFS